MPTRGYIHLAGTPSYSVYTSLSMCNCTCDEAFRHYATSGEIATYIIVFLLIFVCMMTLLWPLCAKKKQGGGAGPPRDAEVGLNASLLTDAPGSHSRSLTKPGPSVFEMHDDDDDEDDLVLDGGSVSGPVSAPV